MGSDVAMVLDHVVALPNDRASGGRRHAAERALGRALPQRPRRARSGAVRHRARRARSRSCGPSRPAGLAALDFPGYAIGGLSVGETPDEMYAALDVTLPHLPADRPRYLMGVGRPIDLLEAIARGVDLFDCVLPTRNGRNALAFTDAGPCGCESAARARSRPLDADVPLPGLPAQPRLSAAPVSGGRDAGADPALDPQPDVLPAAAGGSPAGDRRQTGLPQFVTERRSAVGQQEIDK